MTHKKNYNCRSNHKSQKGGKKLGYGAYGCVISPPAKCLHYPDFRKTKYKIDKNHVSKLIDFKHNQSAFLELNIGQKLIKIDPKHHHFSPYFNGCFFSPQKNKDIMYFNSDGTDATSSPLISDVSSFKLSQTSHKTKKKSKKNTSLIRSKLNKEYRDKCLLTLDRTYLNLIGPYGGSTLSNVISYSKNNDQLIYIKKYYWYLTTYLIDNLRLLHRNKIIHLDLKPSNITIDFSYINDASLALIKSNPVETCRLTFIDFGLAQELKKKKYSYDEIKKFVSQGTSHYIPVEIFIIRTLIRLIERGYESQSSQFKNKILSKIETKIKRNRDYYHYEGIRNDFFKYQKEKGTPGGSFFLTPKKVDKITEQIIKLHSQDKLSKNIIHYLYGWDIYSLGITLAKIVIKFRIEDQGLTSLIFDMIRLDPDKRITMNRLIRHPKYNQYHKFLEKGRITLTQLED